MTMYDIYQVADRVGCPTALFILAKGTDCGFYSPGHYKRRAQFSDFRSFWPKDQDVGKLLGTAYSLEFLEVSHPELFV